MNTIKKYWQNDWFFLGSIYTLVLLLFRNAFSIRFFSDDLFFLKISNAHTISHWLYFFIPGKDYFFRPVSSEFFYWLIHLVHNNLSIAHSLTFFIYFIGLYFLYQSIKLLTNNILIARLTLFLYAIHLVHVFQLYYLATFQEIALFTFLSASFYFFLKKKLLPSLLFFILALMSKETALFYPLFLIMVIIAQQIFQKTTLSRAVLLRLIPYLLISGLFALIFKYSLSTVSQIDIYQIHYSYHLTINNFIWYLLWSFGLPNLMPLYMSSLIKPPTQEFFNLFAIGDFQKYFSSMTLYWLVFLISSSIVLISKKFKESFSLAALSLISFTLFIFPALLIIHRWMVRLTIPLIFISILQGLVLMLLFRKNKFTRVICISLLILYLIWNFFGIKFHESSSLYLYENEIAQRSQNYFKNHYADIIKNDYIYFKDDEANRNIELKTSAKLYTSFSDQSFINFYFHGSNLKAIYNFKENTIPKHSFIINSTDLLQ